MSARSTRPSRIILVVDDQPMVRVMVVRILAGAGYVSLEAGNGEEALAVLRSLEVPPDVVLLDLEMPVMDGNTFLAHLEAGKVFPRDKVVIFSSTPDLGPPDLPVVTKGSDSQSLLAAIEARLGAA